MKNFNEIVFNLCLVSMLTMALCFSFQMFAYGKVFSMEIIFVIGITMPILYVGVDILFPNNTLLKTLLIPNLLLMIFLLLLRLIKPPVSNHTPILIWLLSSNIVNLFFLVRYFRTKE